MYRISNCRLALSTHNHRTHKTFTVLLAQRSLTRLLTQRTLTGFGANRRELLPTQSHAVNGTNPRYISQSTYEQYFSLDSVPVGTAQQALIAVHDWTGLPWWAVLCLTTVTLRSVVTLPLMVYSVRNRARLELLQPEIKQMAEQLKQEVAHARLQRKWDKNMTARQFKANMKRLVERLYVRDNCHPMKEFILPWIQIPLWVCMSLALRSMAGALSLTGLDTPVICPSLETGGFLWFSNLLIPDTTFILPITLSLTNLLIIEMHNLRVKNPTKSQKYITYALRGFSIVMVPIAASVPSCMSLYWTISSLFGFIQNILLQYPSVRRTLCIPLTPSQSNTPFADMYFLVKQKLSRTKV